MTDPSTIASLGGRSHVVGPFHPFSSLVKVDVSALTHPGLLRENNEDQFYVARMSRALETITTSLPPGEVPERAEEVNHALVVADGMGGHAAGEVASRLTVTALVANKPIITMIFGISRIVPPPVRATAIRTPGRTASRPHARCE